jgi:hypothetical protein
MVPCELLVVGDRSDLGNPGEDRVAPGGRRRAEPLEAVADESTEELAEPAVRLERPLQSAAPLAGDEPVMAVDAASRGRGAIEIERVRDDESTARRSPSTRRFPNQKSPWTAVRGTSSWPSRPRMPSSRARSPRIAGSLANRVLRRVATSPSKSIGPCPSAVASCNARSHPAAIAKSRATRSRDAVCRRRR